MAQMYTGTTLQGAVERNVLLPLSTATATLCEPLVLFPNERLEIDCDPNAKHFIYWIKSYKPYQGTEAPAGTDIVKVHGDLFVADPGGASMRTLDFFKRVPEAKELSFARWKVAATDFSVVVTDQCWPADRIIFKSDAAELMYKVLLSRFYLQTQCAIRTAEYRVNNTLPEIPADFPIHPTMPPLRHQWVPIINSLFQEAYAYLMEQGTCKTSTAINRISYESMLKVHGRTPNRHLPQTMYRVLVMCPNAVRWNWEAEFQTFSTVPGKAVVCHGDEPMRARRVLEAVRSEDDCWFGCCILGHDAVGNTLESLLRCPWDLVIWDESHLLKNDRTDRWTASRKLLKEGHCRQRLLLTGTPIANTAMDLWAQFELLGEGLSGFTTMKAFRTFYGKFVKTGESATGTAIEKLVGIKNVPLLQERLARMSFMITKEQAGLDLPDKVYDTISAEMTPAQAAFYRQIRDQLAIELQEILEGTDTVMPKRMTANHVLTKMLRLAHITSGFVTWDEVIDPEGNIVSEGRKEVIPGGNPKMEAVIQAIREDMESDPLGKKIIWASWQPDLDLFEKRIAEEGWKFVSYHGRISERQRKINEDLLNNDPTVDGVIANPSTGGTGVNFLGYDKLNPDASPRYVDHEFFFSMNWNPVLRSQAEDRAHRKGTRSNVRITDVVVPGTVDEDIRLRTLEKQKTAFLIQDVRDILRNILYKVM